jgi:hypothetical protein
MAWVQPPESVTWTLAKPIQFGSAAYDTITLRAPCAGDVLKAQAIRGSTFYEQTLRLIAAVGDVPYEALIMPGGAGLPVWVVEQMSGYFDSFNGAPVPRPLQVDAVEGSDPPPV